MKKTLIFTLLLFAHLFAFSQMITVSVGTITANPGDVVNVPVTLVSGAGSSGTPVSACDVNITYNDNVLTYLGLTNFYPVMPAAQWVYSGNISIVAANWFEPGFGTVAIPDGTVLFEIQFTYNGGNCDLNFIKNEFYDSNYELIPTTPVNGGVYSNTVTHAVTFRVDMSHEEVSPDGVHLAGSFNNWEYAANPMSDVGNGIYSATLSLDETTDYTYRFVNGINEAGLETVPEMCGVLNGTTGQYDRLVQVADEDITLDTVCFSRCGNCPPVHNITFRVDMQNESVSVNGMHLAGTFNNWDYGATEMVLTGAGAVYEVTLPLEEGQYNEYRFVNGNTMQDAEIVPSGCSNNGNRYLTVPDENLELQAFCYGECVECGNLPQYYTLTFRVDLKNETISQEGVHIAGSFQGWQPSATPMMLVSGTIYSYSLTLLEGSSVEYRFVNGNTVAGYENVPAACAMNSNRYFSSISSDTILPVVCFSECDSCATPMVLVTFRVDMSETEVSEDGVHLAGSFQGWDPAATLMETGPLNTYSLTLPFEEGELLEYKFVNGNTTAAYESVPEECAMNGNRYLTVPSVDSVLIAVCFGSCEPCPVGIREAGQDLPLIALFPNPCEKGKTPGLMLGKERNLSISIYSVQGKQVSGISNRQYHAGFNAIPVDNTILTGGIYLVIVRDTNSSEVFEHKLIIAE